MNEPVTDTSVVQELVRNDLPQFAGMPVSFYRSGWDNDLYLLGSAHILRLPRNKNAAKLLRKEQRWLPKLAPFLPVATPVPIQTGVSSTLFPFSWSLVPYFLGDQVTSPESAAVVKGSLAFFLQTLFSLEVPLDLPENPHRQHALQARAELTAQSLEQLNDFYPEEVCKQLEECWQNAAGCAYWPYEKRWIHGDLHPFNLVTAENDLRAVIDFGDLTVGDPATDLAIGYLLFEKSQREDFFRLATRALPADPYLEKRTKGWAISFILAYCLNADKHRGLACIGHKSIERIVGVSLPNPFGSKT